MRKLIGFALIALGGVYGAKVGCDTIREKTNACRELAQSLRRLKSEVALHRKLPDALCAAAEKDTAVGAAFRSVAEQIRNAPLAVPSLSETPLPSQAKALFSELLTLLGGAEKDCLDAIEAVLAQLDDLVTKLTAQERDQVRVCRTMWLSGAAVVAILLG